MLAVFTDDHDFTIRNSNLRLGGGANFKKGIVNLTANYHIRRSEEALPE